MKDLIIWGIVFAVMVIAELATFQLVSIWFAAGAAAAFVTALMGPGLSVQLAVFTAVSVILLIFTRPLLKKFTVGKIQPTNKELDIGKTATVIERIDNASGSGRARLNGVDWKAYSSDGAVIEEGEIVIINDIKGTKLCVSHYIEKSTVTN